jgi:hypothetical protein
VPSVLEGRYSEKSFTGKSMQHNPQSGSAKCEQNSYVQLSTKIMKLEKSNKKLKRANIKCKRNCCSDSEESD